MATAAKNAKDKPKTINITVDTEPLTADAKEMVAREILDLAGKDPASYDLVEVKGKRERHEYQDDETVKLHKGSTFITAYTGQTPVS
jgi:uncharacterized protein YpuA (DUF1002 family)